VPKPALAFEAGDPADESQAQAPLALYQVLIEEYQSQRIVPPIPEAWLAEVAAKRSALEEELPALGNARARQQQIDAELLQDFYCWLRKNKVRRTALCLSGGGIRSATFGLGIAQGLAKLKLLGGFHFLSTVSGGGYLGAWLTAWIHREEKSRGEGAGLLAVQDQLSEHVPRPGCPEPEPVRHLRSFTRYMCPRPGFLSADTWTLGGTYLRNVLLNWMVLLPLIAAALMFPRFSTAILRWPRTRTWLPLETLHHAKTLLLFSSLLGVVALSYLLLSRPSLAGRTRWPWSKSAGQNGFNPRKQGVFLLVCILPLWLLAVGLATSWGWVALGVPWDGIEDTIYFDFVELGALFGFAAFLVSRIWVRTWIWADLREAVAVVLAGCLGGLVFRYLAEKPSVQPTDPRWTGLYVCLAGPLLLVIFLLAATVFVGLTSRLTDDGDREWAARAGSWVLILIVMRSLVSVLVIFGPQALTHLRGAWAYVSSATGVAAGLVTILVGRSAKSSGPVKSSAQEGGEVPWTTRGIALALAAPVFCCFLVAVLSLTTNGIVHCLARGFPVLDSVAAIYRSRFSLLGIVLGAFLAVGLVMGVFVNINKFSLHGAYRDRLVRAYLGASRVAAERTPDPLTGFDEGDNLSLADIGHDRPLHLVNATLNLVGGKDLAWQDRKAAPFSVSRLHAGSRVVGYRRSERYGYSKGLKRAVTLGTAMAISGAAANPNMGYHSSPVISFLMTLFNVRLGWWLGNPGEAGRRTFDKAGPLFAPSPLLSEAFGRTNDQNPWINLSDGGHFENLGLYEMVLRRCHFIVVSDAGCDAHYSFEDLGNAVSKVRIDLGVPIVFDKLMIRTPGPTEKQAFDRTRAATERIPYGAMGRICYSRVDPGAEDGVLLYIKASLNGTEPVDVYNYSRAHTDFPHESTANQLYSEVQFECYRALGKHILDQLAEHIEKDDEFAKEPTIETFFEALESHASEIGFGKVPACG
jgi:hypothetical protein